MHSARSFLAARWFAAATLCILAACGGESAGTGGVAVDAGSDGTALGGFHTNPNVCAASAGLLSAMRSVPLAQEALHLGGSALAHALVADGYAGVTATDDLGLAGGMAARDERGDWVVLLPNGAVAVASACPLGSLGQVHRLDEALARALRAMATVSGESGAVLTLRWAWPTAIYGEGGRYWRQALGEGLDLNAPTNGVLGLGGDAALGFVLAGASHPGSDAGDVVGIDSLSLGGAVVVEQDKRIVRGSAALRWELPAQPAGQEIDVALDMTVADASLRWQVGTWLPYVEALFTQAEGANLSVSLQGSLGGALRVTQPIAAAPLPAALTHVGATN